jgi:hypothetical protein
LHRGPGVVGARLLRFLIQEKAPAWTASAVRGILSCIGRPATHVDEVSAPHGESLGLVRAPSAGRAHRAGPLRAPRAGWAWAAEAHGSAGRPSAEAGAGRDRA